MILVQKRRFSYDLRRTTLLKCKQCANRALKHIMVTIKTDFKYSRMIIYPPNTDVCQIVTISTIFDIFYSKHFYILQ